MTTNSCVTPMSRVGLGVALVALVVVGPLYAASAPSDAWITTRVKLSLLTADGMHASRINVDTVGRKVTLHGIVDSRAEKESAEAAASRIEGVETVRNLLQVVLPSLQPDVEANDEQLSRDVTAALAEEPSLTGSTVTVQSVNKGVVLLEGEAKSLSDHLTAVQLASQVAGVRQVASEIRSDSPLADPSIWKNPDAATDGTDLGTIRGAAKDLYITSKVKMRLLADTQTPALDINVDTRDGAVTLFGIVPSEQSKIAAEAQAREAGVKSVENQLQVVSSAVQPAVKANDDVVEQDVKEGLDRHAGLGSGVGVEVSNCVVRLTGTVPSGVERVEVLQIARATTGVCGVQDNLLIR